MRILVTNDDGIDSVGLHVLARAMLPFGEIVVGAPDSEYSGASAAFGALHQLRPELHRAHIDGIDEAWSISGPPALCVMFARLGAFGEPFDLIVSGINPGANVGRAVYHSGTIGAAITGRNGGVSGVAVSQAVSEGDFMGQGMEAMLLKQKWDTAASVAADAVADIIANPLSEPSVLNINVPNCDRDELKGVRHTGIAMQPMRAMSTVAVEPKPGHEGAFHLTMEWGEPVAEAPVDTDVGAVAQGYAALTWLSKLHPVEHPNGPDAAAALEARLS